MKQKYYFIGHILFHQTTLQNNSMTIKGLSRRNSPSSLQTQCNSLKNVQSICSQAEACALEVCDRYDCLTLCFEEM